MPYRSHSSMPRTPHPLPSYHGISTGDLWALFDYCNTVYFKGELRPSAGFELRFTRSVRLSGCFTYCLSTHTDWGIEISRRLQQHPRALVSTLVHEMIHMLAHQRYRDNGDTRLLDEAPVPGRPFVNPGHGDFFITTLERLNKNFPHLGLTVKSTFGDQLYDQSRIAPVRLLTVDIEPELGKGMVYRMHPQAPLDWAALTSDRKSTRLNSSHVRISYAVFCLKKKKPKQQAMRRARIAFGGIEAHKDAVRASLGVRGWDGVCVELRISLRVTGGDPGGPLVAVL